MVLLSNGLCLISPCCKIRNNNSVLVGHFGHLSNFNAIRGVWNWNETFDGFCSFYGNEGVIRRRFRDYKYTLSVRKSVSRLANASHLIPSSREIANNEDVFTENMGHFSGLYVILRSGRSRRGICHWSYWGY
ncbi:hypothetical protein ATCV1_z183L [Acanthocystis turfacea chlorella virus 1]|uniref:Uncharacterized protein z183L n=1 Tax=Chlorovirus heliozoae TaxID=322019 RepID=A7K8E3_9PHYC|nr:hypothetical protein ATCV1_z183L [Acanthocystis turfacea chlorella virus 1]ABT16317.1 hypothetical protein ATCV1_z183L [Acanthocystis turfacea chlorella virus 1]